MANNGSWETAGPSGLRQCLSAALTGAGRRAIPTLMKLFISGVIYGTAFVASYVFTNTIGAGWFAGLGEWVHVGRALFTFTVGYWAGKLATVLTK